MLINNYSERRFVVKVAVLSYAYIYTVFLWLGGRAFR